MSDAERLKATVFVGGLDNQVTTQTLHYAFIPFGEIVSISLPKPQLKSSTDPHRGFGYVEFEEAEDAVEAIYNMDQSELFGRVIKVAAAKAQQIAGEGLGSRTAVWEQEGYLTKNNAEDDEGKDGADAQGKSSAAAADPMQGLEGLDVAGPKVQKN